MASIDFNDGSAGTLVSPIPAPGNRFLGWVPKQNPVGPRHHALGTGIPYKVLLREENRARLTIANLKPTDLVMALRFQRHAEGGGVFTVNTADSAARSYTCYLAEGASVEIAGPDDVYEYTLSLEVMNVAQTTPLQATY